MRTRPARSHRLALLVLGLVALLALSACSDDDGEQADDASPSPSVEATDGATPDDATSADVDLPEGVAATVDGAEIPASEIEQRVEAARADEQVAAQLEGEQGETLLSQFRAQTLSTLVQTRIVLDGAEELDALPGEEDIAAARERFVEQVGGQEAFEEAVASSGMSEQALDEQLRSVAALDVVGEKLAAEAGADATASPSPGAEDLDPADVALQAWFAERLADAEVLIDPEYGQWDATSGQVLPSMPVPAPGADPAPGATATP